MCTGYERGLKIYYKEKEKINEKKKKIIYFLCFRRYIHTFAEISNFTSLLRGGFIRKSSFSKTS